MIEEGLNNIENSGARNLVVKKEEFKTPNGIQGVRAYGTFDIKNNKGKITKQEYQYVVFGQAGALQQIIIVYGKEDTYAQDVKERIVNSIELTVTQGEL